MEDWRGRKGSRKQGVSCRHRVAVADHRMRQYNRSFKQFYNRCPWIEGNQEPQGTHPPMGPRDNSVEETRQECGSHLQLQFSLHTHTHTHTHRGIYTCTHAHTHKHTGIYARMHAHTHTHTHANTHTHSHTCVRMHRPMQAQHPYTDSNKGLPACFNRRGPRAETSH